MEDLLKKTKHDLGRNCDFFVCNLSQIGELESLHQAAVNFFGPIDTLVNNAGITRDNLFMRMKEVDWEEVINLNLSSNFILTKLILKNMMKKKLPQKKMMQILKKTKLLKILRKVQMIQRVYLITALLNLFILNTKNMFCLSKPL